jgi:hypothetical protein
MSFRKLLNYELLKLSNRRNIVIFIILGAFAFLLLFLSLIKYNTYLSDRDSFQEAEKVKINQYVLYNQLGAFGVRLLFLPSPSAVLFSDTFSKMISNVNTAERLKIYKPFKGESVFEGASGYMTFAGVVFMFGGFFSLLFGFLTFRNRDYIKFSAEKIGYKNYFFYLVVSRLFVIYLCFGVFAILTLFFVLLSVGFVPHYILLYLGACFLILTFFFFIGLPVGFVVEKGKSLIVLFLIYFIFIFAFPGLVNKLNSFSTSDFEKYFDFELKNIRLYTDVEKRLVDRFGKLDPNKAPSEELINEIKKAVNDEFVQIAERERKMKAAILEKIRRNQIISSLIPTSFILSGMQEISSTGLLSFIDFYTYNQKMKKDFLDFYVEKSYQSQKKPGKVESFIKGDENIFQAQPRLPYGFWLGVGVTLFYTVLLLFFSYRKFARMMAEESFTGSTAAGVELPEGSRLNFVLCKSPAVKAEIVRHFKSVKNATVLQKVNPDDFVFSGVKPVDLFRHLVDIAGVYIKPARENLKVLGISDLEHFELTREVILKIYAAVLAAGDSDYVIIDDYIKRESKEFEAYFFKLTEHLHTKKNRNIIYLDCEMFETRESMNGMFLVARAKAMPIKNIFALTLR